jgi:hypothetical protein
VTKRRGRVGERYPIQCGMSANVATKPKTRPVAAMRICLFMTLFSCGPLRKRYGSLVRRRCLRTRSTRWFWRLVAPFYVEWTEPIQRYRVANPEQWEQSGRLCHPLKAEGVWRCATDPATAHGASGAAQAVTAPRRAATLNVPRCAQASTAAEAIAAKASACIP